MLARAGILAWLALALAVGASGWLARSPLPPPAFAFGLAALFLLAVAILPAFRDGLRALGPGPLVAFHAIRILAGGYFLIRMGRGELPPAFALPAGIGDMAVGLSALLALWFCVPVRSRGRRLGLMAWNALGLADILLVLGNGVRLFLRDPVLAEPFTRLPLALLPLFVVPFVLATHVLLFVWVGRDKP